MAKKRRKKYSYKKRKRVFIIEMVVLVLLSIVLFAAIWLTHKFSLINRVELDESKIKTSQSYNQNITVTPNPETTIQSSSTAEPTPTPQAEQAQLTGVDVFALVGLDSRPDDPEVKNSDTMMICVIDHNNKSIRLCSIYRDTYVNVIEDYYGNPDYYTKANAAYNYGGPEQFLSMINLNFDLNITEFMTVDFIALAQIVDLLGGIDIDMTLEEVGHVNNYNVETSEVCGVPYEALEIPDDPEFDGVITKTFHCNGTQAVSYARIRHTQGNDFRRASRQRMVLSLIKEKAASADLGTLDAILNAVLPNVTTNIDNFKLISMVSSVVTYDMGNDNQTGFPFVHVEDDGSKTGTDCVIPVTLEYNVQKMHEFLFPGTEYYPSVTVQEYSNHIINETGYTSEDIEWCSQIEDNAELSGISYEDYLVAIAQQNNTDQQ